MTLGNHGRDVEQFGDVIECDIDNGLVDEQLIAKEEADRLFKTDLETNVVGGVMPLL